MSAVRFSLLALAFLAGCDGNPFTPGSSGGGVSANPSVSSLTTTTGTLTASGSLERHEVHVSDSKSANLGNGFAFKNGKINYNSGSDTFTVDNLAFDGANVYTRDTAMDGSMSSDVKAFAAASTYADSQTGVLIDQFSYRALYGASSTGRSKFAIVRTGAYVPYGFGGFIYSRTGGVTLPTTGQAAYSGSYTALKDANADPGGDKLLYVTGDMTVNIDFEDFNPEESATKNGAGVDGFVTNRKVFDLAGNDVTQSVLDAINADNNLDVNRITELPTLRFKIGPGALDNNGELEGELNSTIPKSDADGLTQEFEAGKYYAVLSGANADEVVGVIVVTSKINTVPWRETGGFILYRP